MGLVGIAAVAALVWLAFREAAWFRRMFGLRRFSARETVLNGATGPDEALAGLFARLGGAAEPTVTIGRSVHRTTWGVRLLTLALSAALFTVVPPLLPPDAMAPLDGTPGAYAILALVVYSNVFLWAYRLEIDRDVLSVMGPAFGMRDYPLSGLERIEEDGPYAWRMRFADGRRPHVTKTVVGAAGLRQRLADVLEANERG